MRNAVVLPHPEGPSSAMNEQIRHYQVERMQSGECIECLPDAVVADRAHRARLAKLS